MPIKVKVKEHQLGRCVRLTCIVSLSDEIFGPKNQEHSEQFNVNDLATVHIKFECENRNSPLTCSILALNCVKYCPVKVKVSCRETDEPSYLEWICKDEYKLIGSKNICDTDLNGVSISLWNINITANKLKDTYFTDFNLTAADGTVAFHRAYLAAHSDVFRAMLSHEWKEVTEGFVRIEGVTQQTLKNLKNYMYLNTLPNMGLEHLLLLASYYLMDDLKEQCVSQLAVSCTYEDWSRLLEFGVVNKIPELISSIMLNPPWLLNDKE